MTSLPKIDRIEVRRTANKTWTWEAVTKRGRVVAASMIAIAGRKRAIEFAREFAPPGRADIHVLNDDRTLDELVSRTIAY